ncbi:DoxX family membrane protein [Acetobacter sp. DmW_136]|uniref:MauE/DoxX family redox-associated membrane protein n=1 Tax=Acetobacter sp. DmW_136 TaxID=2591091 RepID=UPI0012389CBE|nr:MauE/DoxX family redox-associated membrane protein [Acetobacter sp. DmW_136]KAA8384331.1 DoxX family membrane protein [Acetobacter sp. DmW_136]
MSLLAETAPLAALCAGGIGTMFLVAGVSKLRGHDAFLGTLASYRLLPSWSYEGVAWGLAGAEVLAGLALFSGFAAGLGGLAAAAMLVVFALAMGINIARGRTSLSCGCTPGLVSETLSWKLVARTVLCVPLALAPRFASGVSAFVWGQGVMAGVALYLVWLALVALPPERVPGSGGGQEA